MTAKQQMQRGDWYLEDAQLESEIERAHDLMDAFNAAPRRSQAAAAALRALLGAVGDSATVRAPFYCDYGSNTRLGDGAYLNFGCVFLDEGAIHVGARVMLGPGVHIYTVTHPADAAERATRVMRALPVVIEDDAWVGGRSVILPGVTIGRGAIVGAGSVVTKDVAPLTVVGGSPAKFIKHVEATPAT